MIDITQNRLKAPDSLSDRAKQIFERLTASVNPDQFRPSDMPLIEQYANAICMAETAQNELDTNGAVVDGKTSPYIAIQEKAIRSMVALSMRLRLSPQSRFDSKTAAAKKRIGNGSLGVDALTGVNYE
jgi:P27 family predicted phage terminase small subunit